MPGNSVEYLAENLSWLIEKAEQAKERLQLIYLTVGPVDSNHRQSLMHWVIEVALELEFSHSTAMLACGYFDRFLSVKPISHLSVLELIAVSALSLACKFKEGKSLTPDFISRLLGSGFNADAVVTMERYMLTVLDWKLDDATPCDIIDAVIEFTFGENCSQGILKKSYSFAGFCYLDAEVAMAGSFILAIAGISLALKKLRFLNFRMEWLEIVEQRFGINRDKLDLIEERVENNLALVS